MSEFQLKDTTTGTNEELTWRGKIARAGICIVLLRECNARRNENCAEGEAAVNQISATSTVLHNSPRMAASLPSFIFSSCMDKTLRVVALLFCFASCTFYTK